MKQSYITKISEEPKMQVIGHNTSVQKATQDRQVCGESGREKPTFGMFPSFSTPISRSQTPQSLPGSGKQPRSQSALALEALSPGFPAPPGPVGSALKL